MSYLIKTSGATITIGTQEFTTTFIRLVNITCLQETHYPELMSKSGDGTFIIEKDGVNKIATEVMGNLINLSQGISSNIQDLANEYVAPLKPSISDNLNDVISSMSNNQQLDLTEGDYVISSKIILPNDKDIIINLPRGNSIGYGSWGAAKSANDYIFYQGDSAALRQYRFVGEGDIKYGRYGIRSKSSAYFGLDGVNFQYCGWDGQGLSTVNAEAGGILGYDSSQADLQNFWDGGTGANVLNGGAARIEKSINVLATRLSARENLRGFRFQDCGIGGKGLVFDVNASNNIESGLYLASSSYTSSAGCENFLINNYVSNYNSNNGVLVIGGKNNTVGVGEALGNWSAGCYFWYPTNNTWQVGKIYNNGRTEYNGIGNNGDAISNFYVYFDNDNLRADQDFLAKVAEADIQNTGLGTNIEKVAIKVGHTSSVSTDNYNKNIIQFANSDLNSQDIGIDLYDCDCTMAQVVIDNNIFTNNTDVNIRMPQNGTPIINHTNNFTTLNKLDVSLDSSKSQIILKEGPNGMPLPPRGINSIRAIADGIKVKVTDSTQSNSLYHSIPVSGITTSGTSVNAILGIALAQLNSIATNSTEFDSSGSGGATLSSFNFNSSTNILTITDSQGNLVTADITDADVGDQVVSGVQSGSNIVLTTQDGDTITVPTIDFLNQNVESINYNNVDWYVKLTGNGETAGTLVTADLIYQNQKDNCPFILGKPLKRNQEFVWNPVEGVNQQTLIGICKASNIGNLQFNQLQGDSKWHVAWYFTSSDDTLYANKIRPTNDPSPSFYSIGNDINTRYPDGYDYRNKRFAINYGIDGYLRLYDVSDNNRVLLAKSTDTYGDSVNIEFAGSQYAAFPSGTIQDEDYTLVNEFTDQGDIYEDGLKEKNAISTRLALKKNKKVSFDLPYGNTPLFFGFGFIPQDPAVTNPNIVNYWSIGNVRWSNIESLDLPINFTFNTSNPYWNSTDNRWDSPHNDTKDTRVYVEYKSDNKLYLYFDDDNSEIGSWDQVTDGTDKIMTICTMNGFPTIPFGKIPQLLFSQVLDPLTSTPFAKGFDVESSQQFARKENNTNATNPLYKSDLTASGRPWTMTMTMKLDAVDGYIFGQTSGADRATTNGIRVFKWANENMGMFIGASSVGELSWIFADILPNSEWVRLAITYDGSSLNDADYLNNMDAFNVYVIDIATGTASLVDAYQKTYNTSQSLSGSIAGKMTIGTTFNANGSGYGNSNGIYANCCIVSQVLNLTQVGQFASDPIGYCSSNSITDSNLNKIYLNGDGVGDTFSSFKNQLNPTDENDQVLTVNATATNIVDIDVTE